MGGLELGRVNVAARAVGVARAALEAAARYAQERRTFGKPIAEHQAIQQKLADMATQVKAAHLLTMDAARKKDRGERADLEAGMAKLFASETCLTVATEAMRILVEDCCNCGPINEAVDAVESVVAACVGRDEGVDEGGVAGFEAHSSLLALGVAANCARLREVMQRSPRRERAPRTRRERVLRTRRIAPLLLCPPGRSSFPPTRK